METADFPLRELDLPEETLVMLSGAGYDTFLDIINLDKDDFGRIEGFPSRVRRMFSR